MLPENFLPDEYFPHIARLISAGVSSFAAADSADQLEAARIEFLGDKRGYLLEFQKALGKLPPEARREAGRAFNEAKTRLTLKTRCNG